MTTADADQPAARAPAYSEDMRSLDELIRAWQVAHEAANDPHFRVAPVPLRPGSHLAAARQRDEPHIR
jgi:hypothetical protein